MSSQSNKASSRLPLGLAVVLLVAAIGCGPKARASLDYVDPNIGGIGYLLQPAQPHVQMPHGMARLAPITTPLVKDRYLADKLYGFRAGLWSRLGRAARARNWFSAGGSGCGG